MNLLDIVLLIPIVWLAIRGFSKGFIIEAVSLAALIGGIWAAFHFSWYTGDFLSHHFDIGQKYLGIIAFIITFILVVILVHFIGRLIEKLVNLVALGFLNKLAGLVFGGLKAAFLLSIIIFFINTLDSNQKLIKPEYKESSLIYKPVRALFPSLLPVLKLEKWNESPGDILNTGKNRKIV